MKFTLTIESDNAAMVDDTQSEVARILDNVANLVHRGVWRGKVRDTNGNTVGSFELELKQA